MFQEAKVAMEANAREEAPPKQKVPWASSAQLATHKLSWARVMARMQTDGENAQAKGVELLRSHRGKRLAVFSG
jgi:hypothetical protein